MSIDVTNKYGKKVRLPESSDTKAERDIAKVLDAIGVSYTKQFYFDEKGLRNKKYDFAVMNGDDIVFLIEFDGPCHYDPKFYTESGNREERAICHVTRRMISDAEKDKLAFSKGIPILRIYYPQLKTLRELILSYVWVFIDGNRESAKEISMVNMFDKYGWTFDYVQPSEPGKKEKAFLIKREGERQR